MKQRLILSAVLVVASLAIATTIAASLATRAYLPLVAANPAPSGSASPSPSTSAAPSPSTSAAPSPSTSASPSASAAPSPPPPSFNNCQADPNAANAPDYPIRITNLDKVGETVTLRNVSSGPVDVTGWRICSILGSQLHAILSGSLAADARPVVASQAGGPIWSNAEHDDAALYNAAGQLIAYFDD